MSWVTHGEIEYNDRSYNYFFFYQIMPNPANITPEQIKKWVVTAIISDDELFEYLVLKGGNAIDLIHHIAARASIDIDFSMQADFPGGSENLALRIESTLKRTFRQYGYEVFDFKFHNKPEQLSADVADFWGGYKTEFKLVDTKLFRENAENLEQLRKYALNIGQGQKFLIDISRHEYVEGKVAHDFDGYIIYVYSPVMIVCEKLRAICQQMPEYGPVVNRTRPGSARARDFYDIYQLITLLNIDIESDGTTHILSEIFRCKKVDMAFLEKIAEQREFHRPDFPSVQNTVPPGVAIESFDYYFDFTLGVVKQLKAFRNK